MTGAHARRKGRPIDPQIGAGFRHLPASSDRFQTRNAHDQPLKTRHEFEYEIPKNKAEDAIATVELNVHTRRRVLIIVRSCLFAKAPRIGDSAGVSL